VSAYLSALHEAFSDPAFAHSALLSAKIALVTFVLQLLLGTGLGWALSKPGWPGRGLVDILVTLPLVLPPLALGFFLLLLFGRRSVFGGWLEATFGVSLVFSVEGVLLSSVIVGLPLVVKPIEAAIGSVSRSLGEASRTLGRNEWDTFRLVILPNIRGSIIAGMVLATARSLGEVGITLMLGGNIMGKTNTMSLEIYNAVFNGEYSRAVALSALLGLGSIAVLLVLRRTSRPVPM
jgi:molybdate transport system permease protein